MSKAKIFFLSTLTLGVLGVLASTFINSAKLINDFETNVEQKEFKPEAGSVELAEIDKKSERSWKLKAKESSSNADMSIVTGKQVEIIIYDENENQKLLITSDKATVDKTTGINTLEGNAIVTIGSGPQKLKANKFTIVQGKPIEGIGNVHMLLNADGSNQVNASKVIIQESMDDLVFYSVSRSQVSPNTFISGGSLSFIQNGGRVSKYVISGGSHVQSKDTTCTSVSSEFLVDGSGKPSLAIFRGSPVAVQKGNTIKAATIQYSLTDGKVKAIGNVKTKMI